MRVFSPVVCFGGKSLKTNFAASRDCKMLGLQVKILIAVLFQFYGVIFVLFLFRKFKYDQLLAYYALKRSVARRRARYIKMRRLARKKRSKWVESGRSDAWGQNMVNGSSADHEWKRNFRMSKGMFGELCEKLRPYISPNEVRKTLTSYVQINVPDSY